MFDNKEFEGEILSSYKMKDGSTMYIILNGNQLYFVNNDKIAKTLHIDDMDEMVKAAEDESS